ncbi:MAG: hypothetical protein H7Y59_13835 [Anaerolineales bacterium]|nr:hypothetical protein [Anaerolineales bacterium]
MLAKSTKLILTVCLLMTLLSSILACGTSSDPNRFPVKSWNITMNLDQREKFFTQLQNFADKYSLELRSTFHDADKKSFIIVLAGDGFHISTLSHLYSPSEISVDFYNESSPSTSQETFDELSVDLRSHLKDIPSMIIKEKLSRLRISIDENQRQELFTELFTQLRDFADQHSLEFTVSSYDSEIRTFLVEMEGDGFKITGDAVRNIPGEINVDFYIHFDNNGSPTSESQEIVNELFDYLKSYFSEVPNVTITELP